MVDIAASIPDPEGHLPYALMATSDKALDHGEALRAAGLSEWAAELHIVWVRAKRWVRLPRLRHIAVQLWTRGS
jgi:hypothetical protein